MAYEWDKAELWREAASYPEHILHGARPADLPVQQPTKPDALRREVFCKLNRAHRQFW